MSFGRRLPLHARQLTQSVSFILLRLNKRARAAIPNPTDRKSPDAPPPPEPDGEAPELELLEEDEPDDEEDELELLELEEDDDELELEDEELEEELDDELLELEELELLFGVAVASPDSALVPAVFTAATL